jgi:hypothetical protein
LTLITFTLEADRHWSFSRTGTHFLENFFGLVRRLSLGDDRSVTALRIIVKAKMVAQVMDELEVKAYDCGRENIGGVVMLGDLRRRQMTCPIGCVGQ